MTKAELIAKAKRRELQPQGYQGLTNTASIIILCIDDEKVFGYFNNGTQSIENTPTNMFFYVKHDGEIFRIHSIRYRLSEFMRA